ncbi:hypothetical protein ABK905_21890 [Acerihabitans sp. KWT182]|uniref:Uncharacterized protein n=1 Tax=Acerihabitans sp. KWT182 TaxID=3157919 RepID=A0AAU7Q7I3_9GAMM
MFYNYGTDVPDAGCIRRRLLLLAVCARTLINAIDGGSDAVETVHGNISVNRGGEQ